MQAKMKKIEGCLHCNKCKSKCPYGLDTPALLAKNYEDYKRVLAGEVSVKIRDAQTCRTTCNARNAHVRRRGVGE